MNFLDEGGAVLAVRPEDIALRSASGAGMARIESVMPLGHYTQIILVRADGARLKVFIPKEQALGYIPGQTADYSFTRFKQFGAAQGLKYFRAKQLRLFSAGAESRPGNK